MQSLLHKEVYQVGNNIEYGNVILFMKDNEDDNNYLGKFVEGNIFFVDEYYLYG